MPLIRNALQGIRVLDLSQGIAGPMAARLLGDFGAEVVKVEPPRGDPARRMAPSIDEGPEAERSLLFAYLNWNKRGIALDLETAQGRQAVEALVRASDIVIESFQPGELARWGLAPAAMLEWNPRLVVTSVTDFGQKGPHAGWTGSDLVQQAMSGIMQISGQADRAPLKHGLNQAYFCAGLNAAYATLAAHCAAERDGIGDHVDLSVQECLVSELVTCETYYTFMGAIQGRRLPVQDPYSGAPIETRRGYLSFQSGGPMPAETFADLFHNEALRDPRFASNRQRSQHVAEVRELVAQSVKDLDAKALFIEGSTKRLLMGVVQTAPDLLACEQLAARDFFVDVEHPSGRSFRCPGELARMSATPTGVARRAPMLGEHTAEVLNELAMPAAPRVAPAVPAPAPRLPLEGLRVLDLATVIAVPYMAALLSDLGAEVIKIESPLKLDPTRQGVMTTYLDNDPRTDAINRSGMFQVVNRGKRSIVLDMAKDEAKALFRELVAKADIVVDNFTPRVMSGWGLGHEELLKINPKLICLSNTGYGSTGPWRNFPSQGTTLEPTMGISSYSGYRGDKPWKVGQSYPDFLACWTGLAALFVALHHMRETGQGQWIDLGMYQVGAALIPEALLQYQIDGSEPQRIGNEDAVHVPSDAYLCAGEDRWVALTVETDAQWQTLAGFMAGDGLAVDSGLAAAAARRARRDEVNALVAGWVRDQQGSALAERLQSAGIACGPVMNNRDLLLDPHLVSRGFHERVPLPAPMGLRPIMGRPWKLALRAVRIRHAAPRYGEDGRAILRDVLGMDEARIAALFEARVVCTEPTSPKPFDAMGLAELQRLRAIHEVDPDYRRKLGIAAS
ncbi:Succinyl-CoA:(R)-benzylsuccinate CoA-transferase subunit BbsF (plasmid) [Variovorax sp. SRS16]|uniref:CaiB/BaiF CoA transferase family protein n=1 Tax=Variovorax sp. SRS16 TaxID=282217 RepID=UPI001316CAEA|nr:CoA transferase [Variovorax sp. SRS16]VTU45673.1 Succinyl-CoA:(R)-benzylsuccinate CoA-transferase subunit BbsF [Variovorax sp. SRS16]